MTSAIGDDELRYAEAQAREYHVTATPSWLDNRLVVGLRLRAALRQHEPTA
jgi:hypothetical protein